MSFLISLTTSLTSFNSPERELRYTVRAASRVITTVPITKVKKDEAKDLLLRPQFM